MYPPYGGGGITIRVPTVLLTLNSRNFPELSGTIKIFFQAVFVTRQHIKFTEKQQLLITEHFKKHSK